ncbi:FlhC family transcriptional regulator [Marinomonas algarum]|uniref:FlhC family transcriptional regulator n=1 Tax=Marinomonas algarum TaxID=2883105 RepID=A0A9X1LF95_9GAMM|nr:FlhC family transcriptional regulator [Marinomonas algarum]MCB5162610.1 FlhC family transcriptional regulator [Marinomonas algarum]
MSTSSFDCTSNLDLINNLDQNASNISNQRPNLDVLDFDSTLWRLLISASKKSPDFLTDQFSISAEVVSKLARSSYKIIDSLASGVIICFRLNSDESEALDFLSNNTSTDLFYSELDLSSFSNFESLYCFDSSYWLLLKRIAQKDHRIASTVFSVSLELAQAVSQSSDSMLRYLAKNVKSSFALRFSSDLLSEIIDKPDDTLLLLKKYQQCISSPFVSPVHFNKTAPNKTIQKDDSDHEDCCDQKESCYFSSRLIARQLALMGYVTKIIILETGLSDKALRCVYSELQKEGHEIGKNRNSRNTRSSATLLSNQSSKIHASILMQLYYKIAGDSIYRSISIKALERAFRMYKALIYEISSSSCSDRSMIRSCFTIADAWCLAFELRTENAMINLCDKCNVSYFTSVNQSTMIDCPFCHEPSAPKSYHKCLIKKPRKTVYKGLIQGSDSRV